MINGPRLQRKQQSLRGNQDQTQIGLALLNWQKWELKSLLRRASAEIGGSLQTTMITTYWRDFTDMGPFGILYGQISTLVFSPAIPRTYGTGSEFGSQKNMPKQDTN
jgi:hypothetical protein